MDSLSRLSSLGVNAISLSDISLAADIKGVESGKLAIVYGSLESYDGEECWQAKRRNS